MSQHIPQHHNHIPQYVHYAPPQPYSNIGISPQDIQPIQHLIHQPILHQPHPQAVHHHHIPHLQPIQQHVQQPPPQQPEPSTSQPAASTSTTTNTNNNGNNNTTGPLVATGDWTKDLVHLAKTAELNGYALTGAKPQIYRIEITTAFPSATKHALTLQLHTAHILSAHATLEQKSKAIQDIREQKNRLESERTRLLDCLRQVNEDRDKADLAEATVTRECEELRNKITQLTDGEYAVAKSDVDRLRQELGQSPLPSIQTTLDEKSQQYLNERRLGGNEAQNQNQNTSSASGRHKRASSVVDDSSNKRPRGRPKGSRNKKAT